MRAFTRAPITVVLVAWVAWVAWAAWAPPAQAAVESEAVRSAMTAYDDLDYVKAIQLAAQALQETLTREERVAAYRTLAFAHVALGQLDVARADFANLLRIDPDFELDRTISPRARAEFENAKAHAATTSGGLDARTLPTVAPVVRPLKPREGEPLTVQVTYPGGVAERVRIFYRVRGQAAYSRLQMVGREGRFSASIPALDVRAPGMEYHLVLLDEWGGSVAGAGSLARPLVVVVQARPKPVYKRPVFWGVLGGAVAAGAVIVAVVLGTQKTIGPETPATLTLEPR